MTEGVQFIKAAIQQQHPKALMATPGELFTEQEAPLLSFTKQHFLAHGVMPGDDVLAQHGFIFPHMTIGQPITYYRSRLTQRYKYQILIEKVEGLTGHLTNQDPDAAAVLLREALQKIDSIAGTSAALSIGDAMDLVEDDYQVAKTIFGLRGLTTGWPTLDRATLGLQPADLAVVAGRPGMGKTGAILKMAHAAWITGKRALFISMEMPKLQISRRFLGLHTGINPNLIRAGELSPWGRQFMEEGMAEIKGAPGKLFVEAGDFARSVSQVESMILEYNPDAVYIDAAYLLTGEGAEKGYVSKWESMAEVIHQLKALGLRYNIPIIITVQFNRNLTKKSRKEPDMGDIGGTDAIPQDASIVLGIQIPPGIAGHMARIMRNMKNREGEEPDFAYNYRFDPVDFDEIPLESVLPQESEEEEQQGPDLSYMQSGANTSN